MIFLFFFFFCQNLIILYLGRVEEGKPNIGQRGDSKTSSLKKKKNEDEAY